MNKTKLDIHKGLAIMLFLAPKTVIFTGYITACVALVTSCLHSWLFIGPYCHK